MNWYLFSLALVWWAAAEVLRGRPSCPSSLNHMLIFLGPLVAIILSVLAFFI
jgi:hypothetical protein